MTRKENTEMCIKYIYTIHFVDNEPFKNIIVDNRWQPTAFYTGGGALDGDKTIQQFINDNFE